MMALINRMQTETTELGKTYVLATTKIESPIAPDSQLCYMEATHVTVLNLRMNPILDLVINSEDPYEPRRLLPNIAVDTTQEQAMNLVEVQRGLGQMLGIDTIFLVWGVASLEALHLAVSGIQTLDLATNSAFYSMMQQFAKGKGVVCNIRRDPSMSLPEVVKLLSNGLCDIRKF